MFEGKSAIKTWLIGTWRASSPSRSALWRVVTGARRWGRGRGWILAARGAWVAALGFVSLPAPLTSIPWRASWPDTSWMIGLALAARDHLQWGTQIIWTYGPLGYVDNPIFIAFRQWATAATVDVGLQMSLIVAIAVILSLWRAPVWTWLVAAGVLVIPETAAGVPDLAGLLLGTCLLLIAAEQAESRRRSSACAAAAGAVLALDALVKGTSLLCGVALVALFIVVGVVRRWWAALLAAGLGFVGGFIVLWLLAGQSPLNIPAYMRGTLELASGYAAAMNLDGPFLDAILGAIVVVATGLGAVVLWKLRMRSGFHLLLLFFPVVALAFKEGFVRADVYHEPGFFAVVAVAAALLVAAAASPMMTRGRAQTLGAAVTVVGISASFMLGTGMPMPLLSMTATVRQYQQAWTLLTQSTSRTSLAAATSATIRGVYTLPPDVVRSLSTGSVDAIPFDIAPVYGYGLDWDPSPVLQSYSAYTPYLDHADAVQLAAPSGADYILFEDITFDGRYPIFDEPAAFRTLLQKYGSTELSTSTLLVLSRAPQSDPQERSSAALEDNPPTQAGTACGAFGTALPVPQVPDAYTFASVNVPYSLRGSLEDALYKPSNLQIQFALGGDPTTVSPQFRLVSATAVDGLFVSGYLPTVKDLTDAFNGVIDTPIQSLTITATHPGGYQGTVCASFSTIPLTPPS